MTPTIVTTPADVDQLAALLLNPSRPTPVIVISTPSHSPTPEIDATHIAGAVDDTLVYVIRTGSLTRQMTDVLPEGGGVYGGAGRTYPPGAGWARDVRLSPIRFCYSPDEALDATRRLIKDAQRLNHPQLSVSSGPMTQRIEFDLTDFEWAEPAVPVPVAAEPTVVTLEAFPAALRPVKREAAALPPAPVAVPAPEVSATPAPTPNPRPRVAPRAPREAPAPELLALQARVAELEAEKVRVARHHRESIAEARRAAEDETREIRVELAEQLNAVASARQDARDKGASLRRAGKSGSQEPGGALDLDAFATKDESARHAIYLAWVQRIPAGEKADRPLPEYAIGARFTESLLTLGDASAAKALKAVVDILCGRTERVVARQARTLRAGPAGTNQVHTHQETGATCYRANVETGTASARRLHYWKGPGLPIELIRVVLHDEVTP